LHPGNIYFIGCLAENKFEYQIVERIDVYLFSLLPNSITKTVVMGRKSGKKVCSDF